MLVRDEDLVPERRCKGGWNWVELTPSERERRMKAYGVIVEDGNTAKFDGCDEEGEKRTVGDMGNSLVMNHGGVARVDGCNQEGDNHLIHGVATLMVSCP